MRSPQIIMVGSPFNDANDDAAIVARTVVEVLDSCRSPRIQLSTGQEYIGTGLYLVAPKGHFFPIGSWCDTIPTTLTILKVLGLVGRVGQFEIGDTIGGHGLIDFGAALISPRHAGPILVLLYSIVVVVVVE